MISSEDAIYKTCGNRFIVDMYYNSGGARNGFATWHNLNLNAATWHFHSSLRVEKVRQKDDREHRRDLQPRAESEVVEELVAPRPHHLMMIA